ncbi:MAG: transposase [Planctomycetota bacterium]
MTLKNAPLILDHSDQQVVLQAILRVCKMRGWFAHAVHVRSNHVHIVVTGKNKPEKMMVDFKAYATRAIKSSGDKRTIMQRYWTRHGSTRYLWTEESLDAAVKYVRNGQGNTMTFGATKTDQSPERK